MDTETTQIKNDQPLPEDEDPWGMFQDVVRPMTVDQIKDRYKDIGILSQNRNSTIRLSIHNKTGERVVMKILNKSSFTDPKKRLLLYREIRTLQALGDQKHITQLYEVIDSGDRIWVVIEYAAGGELFDFVRAKAPLVESAAREIFRPIVRIVAYMHSINIVHRDLKLENLLLDTSGRILLADFGFSRRYDPENGLVESICGTPHYSPPEIIKGLPHNPIYVDSWSLGVILYMLFYGCFPFNSCSIPELLQSIINAEITLPVQPSDLAVDLFNRLLVADPSKRLSPAEIMKHPWFNKNHLPHPKKPDNSALIHAKVLRDLGLKTELSIDELNTLDEDDLVSYKIIHRKYQNGTIPIEKANLPKLNVPNSIDFDHYRPQTNKATRRPKTTNDKREPKFPFGMNSANARQRFPTIDPYLQVIPIEGKAPSKDKTLPRKSKSLSISTNIIKSKIANNAPSFTNTKGQKIKYRYRASPEPDSTSLYKIRKLQTLRLRSIGKEEMLPRMNCQNTTLDKPEVIWPKLLTFLENETNASIITEQDFGMYLLIPKPHELYFSMNLVCVEPGIGLIGFCFYKIRGDENEFQSFKNKIIDYLGLTYYNYD